MNKLLRLFFFSLKRVHYYMPTLYTTTEIKCQTGNYFEFITYEIASCHRLTTSSLHVRIRKLSKQSKHKVLRWLALSFFHWFQIDELNSFNPSKPGFKKKDTIISCWQLYSLITTSADGTSGIIIWKTEKKSEASSDSRRETPRIGWFGYLFSV